MNAHTKPDLVKTAFHLSGFLTAERKAGLPDLSRQIAAIELQLADRLKGVPAPVDPRTDTTKAAQAVRMSERADLVLEIMSVPISKNQIAYKLGISSQQAGTSVQHLLSTGRCVIHEKRGHYWSYVSVEGQKLIEAELRKREAQLAKEAQRDRPKTPADIKRDEMHTMFKLGMSAREIAIHMKLSRASVANMLRKSRAT
ncbi:MAG: hypothetical protein JWQ44_2952 [Chthoniobacter sp.]|nr:hypothetical protein [Chthoniobacter sp.]